MGDAVNQVVVAGRIIRRLPLALEYEKKILSRISDMTIGADAERRPRELTCRPSRS